MVVGVVSDTHIPDRVEDLHPSLLKELKSAQVDLILHAGDLSSARVLRILSELAPVYAVRGNRDFSLDLPKALLIKVYEIKISLVHGQGSVWDYILDKFQYMAEGYQFSRYRKNALKYVQQSDIVVLGHSHLPETRWENGRLFFNPGSAVKGIWDSIPPSFGLLTISPEGIITPQVIELRGAILKQRKWKSIEVING